MNPRLRSACCMLVLTTFCVANAPANESNPLILAHYMPWYTAKPEVGQWGWHWTMNHFDPETVTGDKREIASAFYPSIGPYDSGDVDVLEYHLLTMKLAGIDGVIVDWYGLTDFRDYAILNRNTFRLLQQCERLKMKFVICYEDQTVSALEKGGRLKESDRVVHVTNEINWLGKYWFKSPSYVRFDEKPAMLSFGHAGLSDEQWNQALSQIQSPILYYSQAYRRDGAVGGFGWPVPQKGLDHNDRFLQSVKPWTDSIPVAFPRFVDVYKQAGVGDGYPQIADQSGKTFQTTLEKALATKSRMIQIATWNDWGEGTQIEPSQEFGFRDLEFIQKSRRQHAKADFAYVADDLRIPKQLYELRKSSANQQDNLNTISELIRDGRLTESQAALQAISTQ
ncbi:MAG: hypothetical protein HKN47_00110 [Pirellulaceae bacterium]|nr:hypothetical protein [Pirellulaceae bacterium]